MANTPATTGLKAVDIPAFIGAAYFQLKLFQGDIDEVGVYNRALSVQTVLAHYKIGIGEQ